MPDENYQEINVNQCQRWLAEEMAISVDGLEDILQANNGDDEMWRAWAEPVPDGTPQMRLYLRKWTSVNNPTDHNYGYVDDPKIDGIVQPGRWRCFAVRRFRRKIRDIDGWWTVQGLRKGYATAWDWSEATCKTFTTAEGNDQYVVDPDSMATISNTTSSSDEKVFIAKMKNIASGSLFKVMTSSPVSDATIASPIIEGETYSGTYRKVIATSEDEEDGSHTIEIVYAQSQYTLNAFSRNNTVLEEKVGYLWGLTKDLAQGIITAWDDGSNRSAIPSYSEQGRLVSLVLSYRSGGNEELSTDWIPIVRDVYRRWHFGWGETTAQLSTFIAAHDSTIGTVEPVDGHTIDQREVLVDQRSELYDVVIVETSFGPHAAEDLDADGDFTITTFVGRKITRKIVWGWNIRRTELETVKAFYNTTLPSAIGVSSDFRVTRDDKDSFDYIGTIVSQSAAIAATGTVAAAGAGVDGVGVQVDALLGATQTEVNSLLGDFTAGRLDRVSVDITPTDNELLNVSRTKNALAESTIAGAKAGTKGAVETIAAAHNADAIVTPISASPTAEGESVSVQLEFDDFGNMHYIRRSVQRSPEDGDASGGTVLEKVYLKARTGDVTQAANDLQLAVGEAGTPEVAEGEEIDFRLGINPDGSLDWTRSWVKAVATTNFPGTSAVPTVTLARLSTYNSIFGYTDMVSFFYGVPSSGLAACCIGVGEYGLIENLTLHKNKTFSGKKILRTYSVAIDIVTSGDGTADYIEYQYSETSAGAVYRRGVKWTAEVKASNSLATCMGYAASANRFSGPHLVAIGGNQKWVIYLWTLHTDSTGWVKIVDSFSDAPTGGSPV